MISIPKKWIIEVDITHRCNMSCRHCNRLCNDEKYYGTIREHLDMKPIHINYLCDQIRKLPKGQIKLIRILGGEPLLSPIIDYAITQFEIMLSEEYIEAINIVTNGTIEPTVKSKPYLVYSPIIIGEIIREKGYILTIKDVYSIKNVKHRNITVTPNDFKLDYQICDRIGVCGIHYSVYGFIYTAACFPAIFMSLANHHRFLHYLPSNIQDFFEDGFTGDVCSKCVSAIKDYKQLQLENPQIQDRKYIGAEWSKIIAANKSEYMEPNTEWIYNGTNNNQN